MKSALLVMLVAMSCEPLEHGRRDAGRDEGDAGTIDPVEEGPFVYVHLRATQAPVEHLPATSGQTPRAWSSGVRSLHLLRALDDPDPVLVFSHGDDFVEASYEDGADTVVGYAAIRDLTPGTFTWARAVHTHVRFTIDATLHSGFGTLPGELDDLIVLSDRTTIDGTERMRGFYRYMFRTAGTEYPAEGSGFEVLPIPGGGFNAQVEDGETAYYFPVLLDVRNDLTADMHMIFEVNVHEGFRWTEVASAGYETGVFDTTAISTEPIVQAGANGYRYFLE